MKRTILVISILCLVFPSTSFGYLEARLFCHVDNQEIIVSMSPNVGGKCHDYILYIE